jgi:hypothetical protein
VRETDHRPLPLHLLQTTQEKLPEAACLKEWKEAIAALPTIKAGKAIRVTLSDETRQLSKNAAIAFKRHLMVHIKDTKLKLEVALRKAPDGTPVLYVSNTASK